MSHPRRNSYTHPGYRTFVIFAERADEPAKLKEVRIIAQTVEIGDRARRKVINLFDTTKMVDETINAYFKILKRTGMYRINKS